MAVSEADVLAGAVQRLVEAFRPERIYLFGSRARGDEHEDSDYDFFVIVPASESSPRELMVQASEVLNSIQLSRDVLFKTSGDFERDRAVVASLAATVEREGRLLYGPPLQPLRGEALMSSTERKAELTRDWLTKAGEDLQVADRVAEAPALVNAVAFHCQQAAEKALKAFLTWHDTPSGKTHKLEELVEQCQQISPGFDSLLVGAGKLTPFAVDSRYPDDQPEPAPGQVDEVRRLGREIVDFVRDRLPPRALP